MFLCSGPIKLDGNRRNFGGTFVPFRLVFCRCPVVYAAVNALCIVDHLDEVPKLLARFFHALVFAQVHFLLLDRADQPLGIAVFARLARGRHTD